VLDGDADATDAWCESLIPEPAPSVAFRAPTRFCRASSG
jgi:hypothetical protein